jgi:CP family cyanate transporter-like MFS transporter
VWRSPVLWSIAGVLATNSTMGYVFAAWLPQIMMDNGFGQEASAQWLALFMIAGLPAALIVPLITVRIRRPQILVVVFTAAWLVSLLGLAFSPTHATLLWILISRIGDGNYSFAMTLINLRTRSATASSALSGAVQSLAYLIAAIGSLAFGEVHALVTGWQIPMLVLVAFLPLALIGGLIASRPRMLEDSFRPKLGPAQDA